MISAEQIISAQQAIAQLRVQWQNLSPDSPVAAVPPQRSPRGKAGRDFTKRQEQARLTTAQNDFYVLGEQTVREIFQAARWAGQSNGMAALWEQVPKPLQACLDFQHILAETRQKAMKKHKPKLALVK
jgi:hypothetical protein